MPAITVSRLSPISPKSPLKALMWPLKRSARPRRCASCPSSQAMRNLRPLISTLTSGIGRSSFGLFGQHFADGFHGRDQPARHLAGTLVQPPRPCRHLLEFTGEPRPLPEQLLGVGLDPAVRPHPAIEAANAGFEPRQRP